MALYFKGPVNTGSDFFSERVQLPAHIFAYFSNYGPEVKFAAPGVNVYSTVKGGGYESYNGTSMASPHVAGVAALMKSVGRTYMLADYLTGLTAFQQGSGLINALRTVQ